MFYKTNILFVKLINRIKKTKFIVIEFQLFFC